MLKSGKQKKWKSREARAKMRNDRLICIVVGLGSTFWASKMYLGLIESVLDGWFGVNLCFILAIVSFMLDGYCYNGIKYDLKPWNIYQNT